MRGTSTRTADGPQAVPIRAADGVALAGYQLSGPTDAPWLVVAHGFTNAVARPATARILRRFARRFSVLAVDFRGHGGSGGRSSVGRDEYLDLDAAVATLRDRQDGPIGVVGFSMGGATALQQAAQGRHRPDAVVSVSAPSRWFLRSTVPMRRVHWLLEHPLGVRVGRLAGVKLAGPWDEVPPTPLELVDRIAPLPLLLVHGTADHYFPADEATALHAASNGHAQLWLEKGMRHAESATTPQLVDRIGDWLAGALPASGA